MGWGGPAPLRCGVNLLGRPRGAGWAKEDFGRCAEPRPRPHAALQRHAALKQRRRFPAFAASPHSSTASLFRYVAHHSATLPHCLAARFRMLDRPGPPPARLLGRRRGPCQAQQAESSFAGESDFDLHLLRHFDGVSSSVSPTRLRPVQGAIRNLQLDPGTGKPTRTGLSESVARPLLASHRLRNPAGRSRIRISRSDLIRIRVGLPDPSASESVS